MGGMTEPTNVKLALTKTDAGRLSTMLTTSRDVLKGAVADPIAAAQVEFLDGLLTQIGVAVTAADAETAAATTTAPAAPAA